MKIKLTKRIFLLTFFPPRSTPQSAKLIKPSRILVPAVDKLSTLSSIRAQKRRRKKVGKLTKREEEKEKKHARFSHWDAGTRWIMTWRSRPRERVRFFSRKNGFSMSMNSVAETAQSRLTRAPRPLENTTRGGWG